MSCNKAEQDLRGTRSAQPVWFFGTCLIDTFYPQAGLDAIALLELCGYEVIYPEGQTCCGQPACNSGFTRQGVKVARYLISSFSARPWPLVVPSASCAGMIQRYPELFEPGSSEHVQAQALAARTFELVSFLLPHLQSLKPRPLPETAIALHQSCAARRETHSADDWETALRSIPELQWSLPAYAEECCGFGGTFAVKSPDVSLAMTADKCQHLRATGARSICSGDCGCLMNLGGYLTRQGQSVDTPHIASILARAYLPQAHLSPAPSAAAMATRDFEK